MDSFRAHDGVDAAQHQSQFDELPTRGWLLDAVDVSGDPATPPTPRSGSLRGTRLGSAPHGLDSGRHRQRFDELTSQGLVPSPLSATGPAERAVFAASIEQRDVGDWSARHGMVWGAADAPGSLVDEMVRASRDGFPPRPRGHGDPGDRRLAGIRWQNHDAVDCPWWLADQPTYQPIFDALVTGGPRPLTLSVADDHALLVTLRDDPRRGLVGAARRAGGRPSGRPRPRARPRSAPPRRIDRRDGGARCFAVFAATGTPRPRRWTALGLLGAPRGCRGRRRRRTARPRTARRARSQPGGRPRGSLLAAFGHTRG